MMHQQVSRPDDTVTDIDSAMCLFWDLEASSSALYQQMAACETNPLRAEAWRKLQNFHLLLGDGRTNHSVYLNQKLLSSCQEVIQFYSSDDPDPFRTMAAVMQLKFLQVMLVASLRQQISVTAMIDIERFSRTVACVTDLVLTSRGC